MSHTKEPWATEYRKTALGQYSQEVFDSEGQVIASMAWYPVKVSETTTATNREANARRIVACVNACAGIPTEALEDGSARAERDQLREMTGGTFYEIKKQRDELMKALEHQCEVLNRNGYSTNKAQEAIARVKGES